ncbi:MAG: VanZ family protein [Deltaproteobacteria bacterium]
MRTFWRDPHFFYYWLPPILWGLAIIGMSGDVASAKNTFGLIKWLLSWFAALHPAQIGKINFYLRKIGHATAYGLMYFLWFRALRAHLDLGRGWAFLCSLGLCLMVSVIDEGHQSFTRFRGGSSYDVLLDLGGAMLTALITFALWRPPPKGAALTETGPGPG